MPYGCFYQEQYNQTQGSARDLCGLEYLKDMALACSIISISCISNNNRSDSKLLNLICSSGSYQLRPKQILYWDCYNDE